MSNLPNRTKKRGGGAFVGIIIIVIILVSIIFLNKNLSIGIICFPSPAAAMDPGSCCESENEMGLG